MSNTPVVTRELFARFNNAQSSAKIKLLAAVIVWSSTALYLFSRFRDLTCVVPLLDIVVALLQKRAITNKLNVAEEELTQGQVVKREGCVRWNRRHYAIDARGVTLSGLPDEHLNLLPGHYMLSFLPRSRGSQSYCGYGIPRHRCRNNAVDEYVAHFGYLILDN